MNPSYAALIPESCQNASCGEPGALAALEASGKCPVKIGLFDFAMGENTTATDLRSAALKEGAMTHSFLDQKRMSLTQDAG